MGKNHSQEKNMLHHDMFVVYTDVRRRPWGMIEIGAGFLGEGASVNRIKRSMSMGSL
jgi:hypothetical protein